MFKLIKQLSLIALLFATGCSTNRAEIDSSLKKYFDSKQVEGCFTMLNNADGKITVYNLKLDTVRTTPGSLFGMVNSLVALQTGVAPDEHMKIRWDGVVRPEKSWNKTVDMVEAFHNNVDPYFQQLSKEIGYDTMKLWIDTLSYGNMNISGAVDSFWLNNQLKVSPDEQLGFVKRLFFDQLPFQKRVQQIVKDMMVREDNTLYKFSYKTGWGVDEEMNNVGWLSGWIEENNHVYFFTTLVKTKSPGVDKKNTTIDITRDILKQYGFFEGKK